MNHSEQWDGHMLDRRFSDPDKDPMGLYQHLKYAEAVYALGSRVAAFWGDDQGSAP